MAPYLPEEILDSILSHLRISARDDFPADDKAKRATLSNVMHASKAFCRLARSHLYHTLEISDGQSIQRFQRLLRILLRRPQNAACVREVCFKMWSIRHKSPIELERPPKLPAPMVKALDAVALSPKFRKQLDSSLRSGFRSTNWDALCAVLMAACTNIRRLDFQVVSFDRASLVTGLVEDVFAPRAQGVSGIRPLQRLTEIDVGRKDITVWHPSSSAARTLLQVPTLDTVRIKSLQYDTFESDVPLRIRHLFLHTFGLTASGFERLLSTFSELKVFSVDWEVGLNMLAEEQRFSQALRTMGSDLVDLSLRPRDGEALKQCWGCLQIVKELRSLRHLEISYSVLSRRHEWQSATDDTDALEWPGFDFVCALPASLKTLRIIHTSPIDRPKDLEDHDQNLFTRKVFAVMSDPGHPALYKITAIRHDRFAEYAQAAGWALRATDESKHVFFDVSPWLSIAADKQEKEDFVLHIM